MMKNTLLDIMNEVQIKKQRKIDSIGVNNDLYENIASAYATNDDKPTNEDSVLLSKVKLNDNSIVEAKLNADKSNL